MSIIQNIIENVFQEMSITPNAISTATNASSGNAIPKILQCALPQRRPFTWQLIPIQSIPIANNILPVVSDHHSLSPPMEASVIITIPGPQRRINEPTELTRSFSLQVFSISIM